MPILKDQRPLFDIPDDIAYVNCASRTPFLKTVVAAGDHGVRERVRPWTWDPAIVAGQVERARGLFAGLIGATADDIAICPAASYGLATAARNLPVAKGQTIVVLEDQFPSNVFTWMEKTRDTGATLITVPRPADGDWTAGVLDHISEATAVAALPPCHWADGGTLDLVAISTRCRDVGAALVVDGTQWIGAIPFDVASVQPDFLVVAAYKWLCCPNGLAFMYVAPKRQDGRPLEHSDYNHPITANSIEGRLIYDETFSEGARRFDVGQTHNLVLMPMTVAALEQVTAWTPEAVAATLTPIIERIAHKAAELEYQMPPAGTRSGHFIGLHKQAPPPDGMMKRLAANGVYAALRCGGLRLAPHVYMSEHDVEKVLKALETAWPEG